MLLKKFKEHVKNNPEKIAVKTAEKEITYEELNKKACCIAGEILKFFQENEKRTDIVGLFFEQGADMIIGTLSTLIAKKTYVPLNPEYPEERLTYILNHSETGLIITNKKNLNRLLKIVKGSDLSPEIFCLEDIYVLPMDYNIEEKLSENEIAYLLYTSGSTGKPKGIIQTYENAFYFAQNYVEKLAITPEDRLTLLSTFSHDAAIVDIYAGLYSGATLFPLDVKKAENLNLADWLQKEEITIYHSVPSLYRYFLQNLKGEKSFSALRYIVLGGEEVISYDVEMFKKYFKENTVLVNLYGQSESSINSMEFIQTDSPAQKITLGEVIPGTEFLVIDEKGEEVLELGIGEIIVFSEHVAKGYFKDLEKTQKVFGEDLELGRFYRTGDLGRLLLDGRIEFMGRKDFQVKIRGYRVEPGEIETLLLKREDIDEVSVVAKKDDWGNNFLCAFIVAKNKINSSDLREYLRKLLPDYMVPERFIFLNKLPLNPTGKIDRKALMEMDIDYEIKQYEPPVTETEKKLTEILSGILNIDKIGVNDNFLELGLHSLKALTFVSKVYEILRVQLPLKVVFDSATIKELARWIDGADKLIYQDIPPLPQQDFYEISYSQKRLWYLHQLNPDSVNYNIAGRLKLNQKVDKEVIQKVLNFLIKRHESLRTHFALKKEGVVQIIEDIKEFNFDFVDIATLPALEKKNKSKEIFDETRLKPFNLEKAPLARVKLIKLKEDEYELIFVMHHIISDGWSLEIIKKEFNYLYNTFKEEENVQLPPLKIQYKDFAAWQNRILEDDKKLKEVKTYWTDKLKEPIPILNLPTDYSKTSLKDRKSAAYRMVIKSEIRDKLAEIGRDKKASLFMVLLSAFNLLLTRLTNQRDILIGMPAAGRVHGSLEKVIGFFINTILLRNEVNPDEVFEEFLAKIQKTTLEVLDYQLYPIEMILDEEKIKYPEISAFFNMLNMGESLTEEIVDFDNYHIDEVQDTKFDLVCYLVELKNGIEIKCHYLKGLFKPETIEYFLKEYQRILEMIADDPTKEIKEYITIKRRTRKLNLS